MSNITDKREWTAEDEDMLDQPTGWAIVWALGAAAFWITVAAIITIFFL
jgi:hypothetical protein